MLLNSRNNEEHSLFSASGAHRWSECTASLVLTRDMPAAPPSRPAAEGTAMHGIVELALLNGKDASDYDKLHFGMPDYAWEEDITDEQREAIQCVIDYARNVSGGNQIHVEQRVYYGTELGVPDSLAFGTGDIAFLTDSEAGDGRKVLHIVDAKFGRAPVAAERNPQLALYAAGMLRKFDLVEDINEVHLHIVQPRVSYSGDVWVATRAEIDEIVKELAKPAQRIYQIMYERTDELTDDDYKPSAKGCEYCRAAPCKRQLQEAEAAAAELFDDLTQTQPLHEVAKMTAAQLGRAMQLADLLEPFFARVREESGARLAMGNAVDGYKMVRSRAGTKRWTDPAQAAEVLADVFGDAAYKPREIITPAAALKMDAAKPKRGDDEFTKSEKEALAARLLELVTQAEDSTTIVPESDSRPAVAPKYAASAEDFDIL